MPFSFYFDTVNFSFENFKNFTNYINTNNTLILPFYFNYPYNTLFYNKNSSVEKTINNILKYISYKEYIASIPQFNKNKNIYEGKIITNLKEVKKTEKFLIVENIFNRILTCFIDDAEGLNINDAIKDFNISTIIVFNPFPFNLKNSNYVKEFLKKISFEHNTTTILISPLGLYKTYIFNGELTIHENGNLTNKAFLQESFNYYEGIKNIYIKESDKTSTIYNILVYAIKEYFKINNLNKAVIGVSGGLDSAVVSTLAVNALGYNNVLGIIMPSFFSSNESIIDAVNLCKNIGIKYHIVPISSIFRNLIEELSPYNNKNIMDISEENLQARIRMIILMWFSNKFGYTVLNTSNKSEIATGYGTIYGDISGALSVIGDLYKTQVYELANFINNKHEIIPINIIKKEPSAELKENQKDSDTLPPYPILDKILYELLENERTKEDIIKYGFDKEIVEKTIQLVNKNSFKKQYLPPILKISNKTFNIDIVD